MRRAVPESMRWVLLEGADRIPRTLRLHWVCGKSGETGRKAHRRVVEGQDS
jgi:hypothetical protein